MAFSRKKLLTTTWVACAFYLLGDMLVFHGPLSRRVDSRWLQPPSAPVALVAGRSITASQLDRALATRLWLEGKSAIDLSPEELLLHRNAALDELLDQTLLDAGILASKTPVTPEENEIAAWLARLSARFENKEALEVAMKSQGIPDEPTLRARIAGQIRREKFVEQRIASRVAVTDDEARKWFERNQGGVAQPERIEVRHLFIRTSDHPPEEAKQKLTDALASLTDKKKDFATLAKELSEDPATQGKGGNLGWMTRDRLPADFASAVFPLETRKPTLVRTKLGWHLVEVTARKPAEPRTFDQAKPEILAAIESVKRRQATDELRKSLRTEAAASIRIF